MLSHANGECCDNDMHGGDGCEPLSAIAPTDGLAMGLLAEEHREGCAVRETGSWPLAYECDCETDTFSTSRCEGCGSYLHGERHAMTVFLNEHAQREASRGEWQSGITC
jgi:hypothetical protein